MAIDWENIKIIAHDGGELTRNDIRRLEALIRKAAMIKIRELEKKWSSINKRFSILLSNPQNTLNKLITQQKKTITKKQ